MVQAVASFTAQMFLKGIISVGAICVSVLIIWLTVAPVIAAANGTNWWLAVYAGYFMIWLGWVVQDELFTPES